MNKKYIVMCFFMILALFLSISDIFAEDWPTYRHDNERNGITPEKLNPPLELIWEYHSKHAPSPAWPDPAEHDFHWQQEFYLQPRVVYDHAYQVVAAGGSVYFGSSTDDKVYCLDSATGEERWSFFTEGPVRLAPTVSGGRVYAGSDDGWVYCLDAEDGSLKWKYKSTGDEHRIPGNERIISIWPVRSSVLIHNNLAIFCAGLFPSEGVYFVTLDAKNGKELKKEKIKLSSQGYLVIKDGKLFTPTGRTDPASVTMMSGGKKESNLPPQPEEYPYSLISAGNMFFAGGDDKIGAFRADDGGEIWNAPVKGKARCLIAANGRLIVSTDKGAVYCFKERSDAKPRIIKNLKNHSPYPKDNLTVLYALAAKRIIEQTKITKGYCLDLGCGDGRLAYEIAKLTDLKIIGVEENAGKVAAARKFLDDAGMYGRVVVHHGSLKDLPYGKFLFNLVVSGNTIAEGKLPVAEPEVIRVLRPSGGVACFGQPPGARKKISSGDAEKWIKKASTGRWAVTEENGLWITFRRDRLPGSGQWTHQYADAGNSSCSNDELIENQMQMQWFGRPGPNNMLDRHSRPHAPLSTNGRMFILGDKRLYGVDAYNGTILWDIDIPEIETRVNIPRDCGYMAADDDYFYIAVKDKCWRIDAETGNHADSYELAQPTVIPVKEVYDWGYLAYKEDIIFGSGVRKKTFYNDADGPWYDGNNPRDDYENNKICSDYIFALGKETKKILWKHDGVIINSAIAVGDNNIFFIENRNEEITDPTYFQKRIGVDGLWKELFLVSLDTRTGEKVWDKKIDFVHGKIVFYLSYANDTLIVVSSPFSEYEIYAFDAADGTRLWQKSSGYRLDANTFDHGGHMQHPVIIGDVVYQDPHEFNLKSGIQGALVLKRDGHGCGTLSGAPGFLLGRGTNPRMYDLGLGGKSIPLSTVSRPGCWINMIPAGGLVLIPEASSGCSCEFSVQTSMAFVSKNISGATLRK